MPQSHPSPEENVAQSAYSELHGCDARRNYPITPGKRWFDRARVCVRALLLQVFFPLRSQRQLVEQIDYNLLFRWFVGLER